MATKAEQKKIAEARRRFRFGGDRSREARAAAFVELCFIELEVQGFVTTKQLRQKLRMCDGTIFRLRRAVRTGRMSASSELRTIQKLEEATGLKFGATAGDEDVPHIIKMRRRQA